MYKARARAAARRVTDGSIHLRTRVRSTKAAPTNWATCPACHGPYLAEHQDAHEDNCSAHKRFIASKVEEGPFSVESLKAAGA